MSVQGRLRAIVIFEQLHNAQLHLKKRRNGNAPLATLCPIWRLGIGIPDLPVHRRNR